MAYTVKAVAKVAGVSVRTLHHYDEIGLLKPRGHSPAGYRLYAETDVERLQQVLFFKELGFDLKEIKRVLSDPKFDRRKALAEHRELLLERKERIHRLIQSVDRTLKAMNKGKPMNANMFDGFDAAKYEEEARQRWGGTSEWKQSQRRWKSYTREDWADIQKEGSEILDRMVELMDRDPADPDVQQCIARHYRQMNERFFSCSFDIYRQLADAYIDPAAYMPFYEKIKPGLSEFMRGAMHAYADTHEEEGKECSP